jgi:uroporphyrinogen-III decarboxylase
MEEKPRLGVLENAPPWWPNFKPPEFTEEDLCEIERYCKKIVENVSNEKGMTPWERWRVTKELGIPDRPLVYNMPLNLAVSRVLDCWSDSLKPGIDMWWYPKLCLKGNLAWVARFNVDCIWPYVFTYGEVEWGGSSRAKLLPYTAMAAIDPPIKTEEDWDRIHVPDVHRDGFYTPYLWMVRKTREFMSKHGLTKVVPLQAAFCGESWGAGVILKGLKHWLVDVKRNPEMVHKCAELDLPFRIQYAKAVLEAGQTDLLGCCAWPGIAGLEPYKPFDKYQLEVTKAIGATNFVWMYGFDQSSTLEYQCQTGSMPMGWFGTHDTPREIVRRVATKYGKVFANYFDPLIAVHGPPAKIADTVKDYVKTLAGPGYIFIHSAVDYWTPQEYVDLVVKTAKEYGAEVYKGLQK